MWRSCVALSCVLVVGCASTEERDDHMISGSMRTGGSMSDQRPGGVSWALAVQGPDVVLEVNGARAHFDDGARDGAIEFEHSHDGRTWSLNLDGGQVHSHFDELTVYGAAYDFVPGTTLRFGPAGDLLETDVIEVDVEVE